MNRKKITLNEIQEGKKMTSSEMKNLKGLIGGTDTECTDYCISWDSCDGDPFKFCVNRGGSPTCHCV